MSLRRSIVASAALMLGAGLVTGVPPAAAHDHWKPWGAVKAPDQTLRPGCHKYRYRYRVNPPTSSWSAEIFLVNRKGVGVAAMAIDSASDPERAWRKWTICRASTVYGRHRLKMKVTYNPNPKDPTPDNVAGWVKPSTFRLTRR